ncbi:hypothetical protein ACP4OV_016475 [Aristida adscensionis]
MFRRAKTTATVPPTDNEVRIQKVEKIELVYNLLTKPSVYAKPMAPVVKHHSAGHQDVMGGKKARNTGWGMGSVEDINKRSERYIREKKKQFLG